MILQSEMQIMATLYKYMDINKIYETRFRKETGLTSSTITNTIKKMETKKWLYTIKEGKYKSVWLTDKGRKIAENSYLLQEQTKNEDTEVSKWNQQNL